MNKSEGIALKNEKPKSNNGKESMLKRSFRFLYLMRLVNAANFFQYLLTATTTTIAMKSAIKSKNVRR